MFFLYRNIYALFETFCPEKAHKIRGEAYSALKMQGGNKNSRQSGPRSFETGRGVVVWQTNNLACIQNYYMRAENQRELNVLTRIGTLKYQNAAESAAKY